MEIDDRNIGGPGSTWTDKTGDHVVASGSQIHPINEYERMARDAGIKHLYHGYVALNPNSTTTLNYSHTAVTSMNENTFTGTKQDFMMRNNLEQTKDIKLNIKNVKLDHAQLDELMSENTKKVHVCKICKETFKKKKKLKKHKKLVHGIVKSKHRKNDNDGLEDKQKQTNNDQKAASHLETREELSNSSQDSDVTNKTNNTIKTESDTRKRKLPDHVTLNDHISTGGSSDTNVLTDISLEYPPEKRIKLEDAKMVDSETHEKTSRDTLFALSDTAIMNGLDSSHRNIVDEVLTPKKAKIYTPRKTSWECKVCNESFDKKKNLTLHMKTHSKKSTPVSMVPPASIARPVGPKLPVASEQPVLQKAIVCKVCFETFETEEEQLKHSEIHKVEAATEDNERKFVCELCGARFRKKWTLQNHYKTHSGEKAYACEICDAKFTRAEGRLAHMVIHTGNKPYKCTYCQAAFNQKGNLNSHMAIHTGHKPFKCQYCEAAFISKTSMREHLMLHTGEKMLRCEICNLKFLTEVRYKKHMEIHASGEKPYKCEICFATFVLRLGYTQHMKRGIHNGDTEFKCPYCDLELTTQKRYDNHILKHTNPPEKYKCDLCFAEFGMKAALARHRQMHSGERPYKCDRCDATFAQTNSLRIHKRLHDGETPFKCDICDEAFFTKSSHSIHMKLHNISFDTGLSGTFQQDNYKFSEALGMDLVERMKTLQDSFGGKSDAERDKELKDEIAKVMQELYGSTLITKDKDEGAGASETENINSDNSKHDEIESSDTENVNNDNSKHDDESNNDEVNRNETEAFSHGIDHAGDRNRQEKDINIENKQNGLDLSNQDMFTNNVKIPELSNHTSQSEVLSLASNNETRTESSINNVILEKEIKREPMTNEVVKQAETENKFISPTSKKKKGFSIDSLIMRKMNPSDVPDTVQSLYSSEMERLSESMK